MAWVRSEGMAQVVGWCLLAAIGLLYLSTLDNGFTLQELEGGDLITHQYAQVEARPGNAPGYPVYTMGGWIWYHGLHTVVQLFEGELPNPIPILSSYSTLWALVALVLLYAVCLRLTRSRRWPSGNWSAAALVTIFFAVTYFFWYYATTTEQYSSAVAHTLAIVYVYLLWVDVLAVRGGGSEHRRPQVEGTTYQVTAEAAGGRELRLLFLLSFLCGLSLAHMVTVAMIVPPLVLLVLYDRTEYLRRPLIILRAVGAALLPLLSYIYVYLRGRSHPEWWGEGDWSSGEEWFWGFLMTAQGQDELSWGLEAGRPFFTEIFPSLVWQELSVPLLVLALVGLAFLGKRLAFLLYGTLALYSVLCWIDRFGNWYQVILPAYPLILLGLLPLWAKTERWLVRRSVAMAVVPALLLVGAIVWRADASLPATDSRNRVEDVALDRPALLLDQPLSRGMPLFTEKELSLGLDYLISVWKIRPDLQVVSSPVAGKRLADGESVLVTWQSAPLLLSELGLSDDTYIQGVSPDWVELSLEPAAVEQPDVLLGLDAGNGISLLGYSVRSGPTGSPVLNKPDSTMDVRIYWTVSDTTEPEDWSVSVRPMAAGKAMIGVDGAAIQNDSPGPVHGLRSFSLIGMQEVLTDAYRLPVGLESVDGLLVILYRETSSGFQNLVELHLPMER